MAALLPILKDIAPIILPSTVHVAKTPNVILPTAPSGDTTRRPVTLPIITGVSKKLHVSTTHLPPLTSTTIRHHSSEETILTITRGLPSLLTLTSKQEVVESFIGVGDYVLIPAWTEYQVSNGSEVEEVVIVFTGTGGGGEEESCVDLDGWGGKVVK